MHTNIPFQISLKLFIYAGAIELFSQTSRCLVCPDVPDRQTDENKKNLIKWLLGAEAQTNIYYSATGVLRLLCVLLVGDVILEGSGRTPQDQCWELLFVCQPWLNAAHLYTSKSQFLRVYVPNVLIPFSIQAVKFARSVPKFLQVWMALQFCTVCTHISQSFVSFVDNEITRHRVSTSSRVQAFADISRLALWCYSNETAPIANPPNSAQLEGIPYHSPMLHLCPWSSVGMCRGTGDRHSRAIIYISRRLRLTRNV